MPLILSAPHSHPIKNLIHPAATYIIILSVNSALYSGYFPSSFDFLFIPKLKCLCLYSVPLELSPLFLYRLQALSQHLPLFQQKPHFQNLCCP